MIVVAMLCFLTGCVDGQDRTQLADVVCRNHLEIVFQQTVLSDKQGRVDWTGKFHHFIEYPSQNQASVTGECQVRYKPLPAERGRYD